jgi:uncharacterized membrane protein YjgN (DUF898 family)
MRSDFDGTVGELFGINLAVYFLTLLTLGFAFPWALVMKQRYVTGHTIVEGKRLRFDGTGGQLFGKWVKIFLLTVVTLGIYSFWAELEVQKWIAQNTHYDAAAPQYAATYAVPPVPHAVPQPVAQTSAPAGWMPDPKGRFESRYWDGQRWTDRVSTQGQQSVDPVP